jgi:hypothetical protein
MVPPANFGADKSTFVNSYGTIVGGGVFIDSCKDCNIKNVNVNNNAALGA